MEIESIIFSACITIFSFGLLVISLLSYRKYKNAKLLFVSGVFIIFFVKGILLSLGLFDDTFQVLPSNTLTNIFDLVMILLLFIATLKR